MSQAPPCPVPLETHVVAIGTSAGGLDALSAVLGELGETFPLPILVVQHLAADHRSRLAALLQSRTRVTVEDAREGERILPAHVYVSPPDRHLGIDACGRIHLADDPPVSFSRPSVDVLFRSLAESAGPLGVAVVLTGSGTDGSRGVLAVHDAGGTVVVQDEASSFSRGMPAAALRSGVADHVLPLGEIAAFLAGLPVTPGGRA